MYSAFKFLQFYNKTQTLSNATQLKCRVNPFSKIGVAVDQILGFGGSLRLKMSFYLLPLSILYLKAPYQAVWAWWRRKDILTRMMRYQPTP